MIQFSTKFKKVEFMLKFDQERHLETQIRARLLVESNNLTTFKDRLRKISVKIFDGQSKQINIHYNLFKNYLYNTHIKTYPKYYFNYNFKNSFSQKQTY